MGRWKYGRSTTPVTAAVPGAVALVRSRRPHWPRMTSFAAARATSRSFSRRGASGRPPPMRQLILGHDGWWNGWLLAGPVARSVPSELDSIANAKAVTAPAVFILAGRDDVVP